MQFFSYLTQMITSMRGCVQRSRSYGSFEFLQSGWWFTKVRIDVFFRRLRLLMILNVCWSDTIKETVKCCGQVPCSNMTWFCIWFDNNWGKICIKGYTHKRCPILHLWGWGMGCLLWGFERKLIVLNDTTLYLTESCEMSGHFKS